MAVGACMLLLDESVLVGQFWYREADHAHHVGYAGATTRSTAAADL